MKFYVGKNDYTRAFATRHCFQNVDCRLDTKQKGKKCSQKLINLRKVSQRRETYCVEPLYNVSPEADQQSTP